MLEQLGFYRLADRALVGDVLWTHFKNYFSGQDYLISGRNGMEVVCVDNRATCRVWLHSESDFIDMWSAYLQILEPSSTWYRRAIPEMNVLAGCGRTLYVNRHNYEDAGIGNFIYNKRCYTSGFFISDCDIRVGESYVS